MQSDRQKNGATICILSPEASNESIASQLSIPRTTVSKYNSLPLVATYIYLIDGNYVFSNNWPAFVDRSSNETISKEAAIEEIASTDEKKCSSFI